MADGAGVPRFEPVTLDGRRVRLEPLTRAHIPPLVVAGADAEIFRWYPYEVAGPAAMARFVESALEEQAQGKALAFVQIEAGTGEVIGSTRFGAIEATHRRAEIGWTWITPRLQRTAINTESKYLLLRHAFETLGLNRVEFKTDALNEKSRRALLRIGAVQEGIFRQHLVVSPTGRIRDSVYFSIIRSDWPGVKRHLEDKLCIPA